MQTLDIPQANDLDTVRRVVYAVSKGAKTLEAIEDWTQYSRRHVQYRLHAARVLGLVYVEGDETRLSDDGERLLETTRATADERQLYARIIERCPVIQIVAPDLLGRSPPDIDDLTERLFRNSRLGAETARRRANGLMAWRRHVLGESLERAPRHPASQPPPPPHGPAKGRAAGPAAAKGRGTSKNPGAAPSRPAPAPEPAPSPSTSKATQLDLF